MTPEQMQKRINELEDMCSELEYSFNTLEKIVLQRNIKIIELEKQIAQLKEAA